MPPEIPDGSDGRSALAKGQSMEPPGFDGEFEREYIPFGGEPTLSSIAIPLFRVGPKFLELLSLGDGSQVRAILIVDEHPRVSA